jgi:ParB/RepB/Spo0J family partition protein
MAERKESQGKLYRIPLRQIVANHNPRNPLGLEVAKRFDIFTGGEGDLWKMATSDDPEQRAKFVRIINEFDPEFAQWAGTFLAVGQLEPVEVRDNGHDSYTLVFGCRRCLAILYNWCATGTPKEPVVEARLAPKQNNLMLLHRAVVENTRKDPNPIERARAFQMMLNQSQEVKEIAASQGISEQTVKNSLALLELEPEVQKKKERSTPPGSPRVRVRAKKEIEETMNEFREDSKEHKVLAWVLGRREDF